MTAPRQILQPLPSPLPAGVHGRGAQWDDPPPDEAYDPCGADAGPSAGGPVPHGRARLHVARPADGEQVKIEI